MHAYLHRIVHEADLAAFIAAQPLAMIAYCAESNALVRANAPAAHLFGLDEAELLMSKPDRLFSNGRKILGDLGRYIQEAQGASTPGQPALRGVRLAVAESDQYVDIHASEIRTELRHVAVLTLIDVTLNVLAAETAVHEKALLSQLYVNSPDAIVKLDLNDRVQSVNPAFTELFGYQESELLGQSLKEFIVPPEEVDSYGELSLDVLREGDVTSEAVRRNKYGQKILCAITGLPIQAMGSVVGLYAIYKDIRHLAEEKEALERAATEDELTGLLNRRGFESACNEASESEQSAALVFIDLDDFKPINDTFGHLVGDKALQAVARTLQNTVRSTDSVGRLGGDEFAILLVNCDEQTATRIAAKIIENTGRASARLARQAGAEKAFELGVSIGIALKGRPGSSYAEWIAAADAACYEAKSAGKNTYAVNRSAGLD